MNWAINSRKCPHAGQALLIGMTVLLAIGAGCSDVDNGTIPITTSSERAREYFRIARDLDERLRPLEAKHYYQEALALDSNFALAYQYLAGTESKAERSLQLLDQAASLIEGVSVGETLIIRAALAENRGDRIKEQEYYRQLVALHPADERAHNLLGNHYYFIQEWEQAIIEYRKAIEIDPDYAPAYNGLGYAYSGLGNYEAAEKAFLSYIEIIPDDPNPYDSYAELLFRTGRFAESMVYYHKALQKNPYFLTAYVSMASVHNYLGQYTEARAELTTMFDRARTLAQQRMAYFAMAVSFADDGNPDSALAQIMKSHALAKEARDIPAMAEDLDNMGDILLECGKNDEALRKYKQAVRLVEQSSLARVIKETAEYTYHYNAARATLRGEDLAPAVRHTEKFRELIAATNDPLQDKLLHELKGTIALAEHEYETALLELQMANLQDPYNLLRLARAYRGLDNRQKAEEMQQQFVTFYADNDLNYALLRGKSNKSLAAQEPE
ncbi:tetratricopeptide repeat protein [Candidatus Zixiibacteriota bacterium]